MQVTEVKTIVLKINRAHPDTAKLAQAAAVLKEGGVIVFPTDTVYGLAANGFNRKACSRIYRLKGRAYHKPLTMMVADSKMLALVAEVSTEARRLIKKFWPGPLTLVLPTTHLGSLITGGRKDVGVRIPDDTVVKRLLELCDFPLATTSANPSAKESAKTGEDAVRYFDHKVDIVLDAGRGEHGRESTVLDMLRFPYVVLREGALPSKKLLDHIHK